ncbi:MAG: SDR family NAD(P)-dependent oxidoreductase [Candidatus Omnitrophota bacterium]
MRLKDKVAVITGGSRGIGRAACLRFAREGAKVVVNYTSKEDSGKYGGAAYKVVEEIKAFGGEAFSFDADVADKEKVEEMIGLAVKKYGKIDVLVANAGICPFEDFLKIDEALLDKVLGVNLKGAFFCAQAAAKRMVELKTPGRIVFTSSVSSIFGGELQAHYCSTKGGVNQMMKSIAISCGKYGITANAVLPGTVITDINREQLESDTALRDYFIRRTPLGRLATPEDIAAAMLFFASDDARSVSGATLIVDGGMSVNLQ